MSRKRTILLALCGVAALATAGVAVAARRAPSTQAASATFDATTVANSRLVSCTINGGDTYAATIATYTGTASSSDARLNGTFKIRARSLIDTNTGLGRIVGIFRIQSGSGPAALGTVDAAVANGAINGVATGRVRDPGGRIVATLASSFDPASGFSSGSLGTGSAAGTGVVLSGAWCRAGQVHPLRWLHRHLRHFRRHG
jgi:hypothetical protein